MVRGSVLGNRSHLPKNLPAKGWEIKYAKKLEELLSETSQGPEVMETSGNVSEDFFDLYDAIVKMFESRYYYNFGKALDDRFDYYKKTNPKRTAQATH
jgi:hypothetical protein